MQAFFCADLRDLREIKTHADFLSFFSMKNVGNKIEYILARRSRRFSQIFSEIILNIRE